MEEGKAAESATAHGGEGAEATTAAELPEELRMDDYDDEPVLPIAIEGGGVDVMDEDEDGDEDGEEEEEEEAQEGFRFMQEPTTGQVGGWLSLQGVIVTWRCGCLYASIDCWRTAHVQVTLVDIDILC